MPRRFIVLTASIAMGLAISALSPATIASAAPTASAQTVSVTRSSVAWKTCADPALAARGAQCAMLSVPLDYSRPNGTTIQIAISRIRHTVADAKYQGVMLVNPGGPGGSGLGLSVLGAYVPNGAGGYYDWIGFDPRGVGSSVPALSCNPGYFGFDRPLYLPVQQSDLTAWLAKSKGYADACASADKVGLLDHLTTVDSAKDMDSIRAALGQKQINYYGFSYGTYLGQVYSTLYPNRVRRAVLDSNVDPTRVWYAANLDQDYAFDRNMNIWFGWLAKYDSVYHLGRTQAAVKSLFYRTAAHLAFSPAGGKIGYDEWIDTFLSAGYYQLTWLDDAAVLANYINHNDVGGLVSAYAGADGLGDDNGYSIYLGVQCTDVQWPQQWSQWAADNWRVNAQAPYETWANAWYNAPCLDWHGAVSKPVTVDGTSVAPILLIDETLDAATPYTGSLKVRSLYPNSRLLALPGGTSHAVSLFGNACEDDLIAAYLATGSLPSRQSGPGPDATCAPLPQPDPTTASAAAASTSKASGRPIIRP